MAQFLSYTILDAQIVDDMAGQAPSSDKRGRAITAEIRNIQTKYSLETFRRKKLVSIKTDGTAYELSDLITENDVRGINDIQIVSDDTNFTDLTPVDYDTMIENIKTSRHVDCYSLYYEDGVQYLRVLTYDNDDTARDFNIIYDTTNVAVDSLGNFYADAVSGMSLYVLVPDRFLDLVSLGAQKRLFYQSIGEADSTQVALVRNRYESELKKLGLDSVSKTNQRNDRKIKLHVQW